MSFDSSNHQLTDVHGAARITAALTAGGGVVHLAVAAPHFADSVLLGLGFLTIGWAQLVVSAVLTRRHPSRTATWLSIAVNLTALTAWSLSRTVGLPVGHTGPEPAALADLVTVAFEVAAAVAAGLVLHRRTARSWTAPTVAVTLAVGCAIAGSSLAIANIEAHGRPHLGSSQVAHGHATEHPDRDRSSLPATGHPTVVETPQPTSEPIGRDRHIPMGPTSAPPAARSTVPRPDNPSSAPASPDAAHTHAPDDRH